MLVEEERGGSPEYELSNNSQPSRGATGVGSIVGPNLLYFIPVIN